MTKDCVRGNFSRKTASRCVATSEYKRKDCGGLAYRFEKNTGNVAGSPRPSKYSRRWLLWLLQLKSTHVVID